MKDHSWEIEGADGTLKSGEDGFPPLDLVDQAKSMVLILPESSVRFRVEIPEGKRLVFFRRNQILMSQDGRDLGRMHVFFMGWKTRGDHPKEKFVQMIHQSPKGEIFSCLLDNDGRQD